MATSFNPHISTLDDRYWDFKNLIGDLDDKGFKDLSGRLGYLYEPPGGYVATVSRICFVEILALLCSEVEQNRFKKTFLFWKLGSRLQCMRDDLLRSFNGICGTHFDAKYFAALALNEGGSSASVERDKVLEQIRLYRLLATGLADSGRTPPPNKKSSLKNTLRNALERFRHKHLNFANPHSITAFFNRIFWTMASLFDSDIGVARAHDNQSDTWVDWQRVCAHTLYAEHIAPTCNPSNVQEQLSAYWLSLEAGDYAKALDYLKQLIDLEYRDIANEAFMDPILGEQISCDPLSGLASVRQDPDKWDEMSRLLVNDDALCRALFRIYPDNSSGDASSEEDLALLEIVDSIRALQQEMQAERSGDAAAMSANAASLVALPLDVQQGQVASEQDIADKLIAAAQSAQFREGGELVSRCVAAAF
jgi:hypothetical protein